MKGVGFLGFLRGFIAFLSYVFIILFNFIFLKLYLRSA